VASQKGHGHQQLGIINGEVDVYSIEPTRYSQYCVVQRKVYQKGGRSPVITEKMGKVTVTAWHVIGFKEKKTEPL
jgi:hypothetical protein